ncbi:hypothetical protein [Micromonospora maris]|uniref:hypothetical protein n=1 Tax=Micromonospora maris TaxID=1003110 RepID=UPI000206B389|nr:hypothetical protein [Micromonospora maris]AEB48026.1 hypothetical protein VAB18032_30314 [Micromonospora maris AB-18-032]
MTLIGGLAHAESILAQTVPNPGGGVAPPGVAGSGVLLILQWIAWLAVAACVAGMLYTAAKMAISHRRGDDTNVSQLGWVFAACVLIGSASAIVGALIGGGN